MDVPFSTRFQNIVSITKTLAAQGQDAAEARTEATSVEQQFLNIAGDAEEYQTLCDDYVDTYQVIASSTPLDTKPEETLPEEVFNTHGPVFGKYQWATFHADGQTSTVYKAKPTDSSAAETVVALKVMNPDRMQPPHNAHRELRLLTKAKHDCIVPLIDSFWQPGGTLFLVFPFLRQDLENLLRSDTLTKSQSRMVFEGLFKALAHLHSIDVIHRDVKPSNLLLKTMDGPVYLVDFGISWAKDDRDSEPADRKITDVGTTCYRPPELLFGHRSYDTSLDMWAAGCVVAEMVRKEHHQLFDAGPLGSELGLVKSMFHTLGTPTDKVWPVSSISHTVGVWLTLCSPPRNILIGER